METRGHGIEVRGQVEYTKIKSKFFRCAHCFDWMIEWTPVIKPEYRHGFRRMIKEDLNGISPRVWLQCPNGKPRGTGFYDMRERNPKKRLNL